VIACLKHGPLPIGTMPIHLAAASLLLIGARATLGKSFDARFRDGYTRIQDVSSGFFHLS
jgi:hypothetical protein